MTRELDVSLVEGSRYHIRCRLRCTRCGLWAWTKFFSGAGSKRENHDLRAKQENECAGRRTCLQVKATRDGDILYLMKPRVRLSLLQTCTCIPQYNRTNMYSSAVVSPSQPKDPTVVAYEGRSIPAGGLFHNSIASMEQDPYQCRPFHTAHDSRFASPLLGSVRLATSASLSLPALHTPPSTTELSVRKTTPLEP